MCDPCAVACDFDTCECDCHTVIVPDYTLDEEVAAQALLDLAESE